MSILSTGTQALLAFHRSLNTTAHNVANAKTPGYNRQSVQMATCNSTKYAFGQVGNGVKISDIRRDADVLAISRLVDSGGELARLQQLSIAADRLDGLFSDKATNIAGMWSDFFDATNALTADAASPAHRQQLLDSARALTTRFHQLDHELGRMDQEINARLTAGVEDINRLSQQIAELNGKIGSNADTAAPELLDRRDQLVAELTGYTGGTAVTQDGGQINVLSSGGHALVVGTTAATVNTIHDPYQPGRLHLAMRSQGKDVRMEDKTLGGQMGGLLEFRREVLDTSRADLGRMAAGLAERFNAAHRQGVDLQGQLGEDMFTYASANVAAHSGNHGSAVLAARYADLGALDGRNVQLHFDGSAWSARDPDSGEHIPLSGTGTAFDPLRVDGMELVLSEGAVEKGDTFLLQPTRGVAASLSVAITDPAKIAVASPIKIATAVGNTGQANASVKLTDSNHPDLLSPASIVFTSSTEYSINGGAPITWTAGKPIVGNGWEITLDTAPAAGDTFTVSPTGINSSDNGNAKHLSDVASEHLFSDGTVSLNAALAAMTSKVGSVARDAEVQVNAQTLLHEHAQSARDAVSGVNLDEEAGNLLQLQQAYQAAAQLISTADTLFQSILNATRR